MGIANSIKLNSFDSLFGSTDSSGITEVNISFLEEFKNHPFKVLDNEDMDNLVESIKENGILNPILCRKKDNNKYEVISGHRRLHAAIIVGLEKVPVIIKDYSDDEATIIMVDSNLQREEILPSEKAFSYKMKLEAMKRQNRTQVGYEKGKRSVELLSDEVGESRNQIQRYIRLTELNPDLLEKVDNKELAFNVAVELSYLSALNQALVSEIMQGYNVKPNLEQASVLKEKAKNANLTEELIEYILCEEKAKKPIKINIKGDKVAKYFPSSYSPKDMENVIFELLESWSKNNKPIEPEAIDENQVKMEDLF